MKKLTLARKKRQLAWQRRAERARRRKKAGAGVLAPYLQAREQERSRRKRIEEAPTVSVVAPEVFSLIENPEGVVRFLAGVETAAGDGYNVVTELGGVTTLSAEAAVLLCRLPSSPSTRK